MKILITGTHFTPAQAVIEKLKESSSVEIIYVGRSSTREGDNSPSVESQILPGLGVKFVPIITGRLQRSFTPYTIPSLLKIPLGLVQSFLLIVKEKPDAVLSFGGYVAVPVVISAWLLSIPVMIHEQTLLPGLANKISALFANRIALTFPQKGQYKNIVVTGNPIRKELLINDKKVDMEYRKMFETAKKEGYPVVFITAGNQGSHIINKVIEECLSGLVKFAYVIHQTGDSKYGDYENLNKVKEGLEFPQRYLAAKWINGRQVGYILRHANLALTRGGVNTLLEAAYFSLPVLLVPIAGHAEQAVNAEYFTRLGLARTLKEKDLGSDNLIKVLKEMLKNIKTLQSGAKKAKNMVVEDAADRLALETILLAKNHQ